MTERIYGAQNFRFDPTTEGVYVYDGQQSYTREGHAEVEIHGPLNPFGSIHTESLTPIFQTDAVYGLNTTEVSYSTGLSYDPGPSIGANSAFIPFSDEITLQPGETLTLAAQTVTGTATWTNMSLNTREDQ